jgi:xanthine/CO dehydrogenase XdhC/CoxF family maturation factor
LPIIPAPSGLSENSDMTDLERILPLWSELKAAGAEYVLATVVAVEGPSYRRPGACMLLTQDGRHAGTVSGGCLEAEVARRAWWLTADGPTVQSYSTVEDDGDRPYGSGCGGVVWLLLERAPTADPLLDALAQSFLRRTPLAVATVLEGDQIGRRAFAGLESDQAGDASLDADGPLQNRADLALATCASTDETISIDGAEVRVWTDFRPARPGLWIFSAGDDVQPLVQLAKALGWYVAIADGRSNLVTRERFPLADELHILPESTATHSAPRPPVLVNLHFQDAAVVMTHSFEQDSRALAWLLALDTPLAYIGALGPQRRTRELLAEAAQLLGLAADPASSHLDLVERWLTEIHAPTGLDLGADSPETIALSIVAEIQKTFSQATALPLRQVRAAAPAVSR